MSEIEEFLQEYEAQEEAENLYHSVFYIPPCYQPQENDNAV